MKTPPSTSRWERDFNRRLQSWKDTAAESARNWELQSECGRCSSDPLLDAVVKMAPWPHWMRHSLRERLLEMRADESARIHEELCGRSAHDVSPSATRAMDDYMELFDRWLRQHLTQIWKWEMDVLVNTRQWPRGGLSLRSTLKHWIDGLDFWRPTDEETPIDECELCMTFYMIDAAGLPGWTPHSIVHDLASALIGYVSNRVDYDWRSGASDIVDTREWTEDFKEMFEESRQRETTEIEEEYFTSMRRLAPMVAEALETIVRPKVQGVGCEKPSRAESDGDGTSHL